MLSWFCADRSLKKLIADAIHEFQPAEHSGTAVAVIRNNNLHYAGGFGFRDRERRTPVNANTSFAIGSCTKAFTSLLACLFAQDNKVALDRPIKDYIANFNMVDQSAAKELTLEEILSQRTGLPRHDALWYLGPFSRSELFYRVPYLDPIPGAYRNEFLYNNIMYMVAGYVLETLFGSWESAVKARIFRPLSMTRSNFTINDFITEKNYAKGYERDLKLTIKDFSNIGPAAEVNSSVLEMAKWILLFLNNGVGPNRDVIINETYLQKIYREYVAVGQGVAYGLGWYIGKIKNKRLLFHQGDADGYAAYVSFMPDDGLGVIALTNQQCTNDLVGVWPDKVAARVYDYLLNNRIDDQLSLPAGLQRKTLFGIIKPEERGSAMPHLPVDYTGMFSNPGYGDICINRMESQICFSYYNNTWPLLQSSGGFYISVWAFGEEQTAPVVFHARNGEVDALSVPFDPYLFNQTHRMVRFEKRGQFTT